MEKVKEKDQFGQEPHVAVLPMINDSIVTFWASRKTGISISIDIVVIVDERREITPPARPTREAGSLELPIRRLINQSLGICRTDIAEPQGPLAYALAFPGSVL
ncbi:unnamed protein product [Fusarium graminearum]|uniref:Uncharacterized protein n=1 Tax=Gibberella zeae TaxID=5518 RepID=A0A4E9D295_GIBZA|nr:unnamed protein product [Fusarium graminearum]CAG1961642.1 unnamed protein product [Fusarium graminearum]